MLQDEQDWENMKGHPFSWENSILTQQGALPPGSDQSLHSLGFAVCIHTLLLKSEVGSGEVWLLGPDVTGHR